MRRSDVPWFIKRETFRRPHAELREALQAHRAWVGQLRQRGLRISSGYLVDAEGRPGGGGLLLLEAPDHAGAEALIRQDPMLQSGGVDWTLHRWIGAVGDLAVDPGADSAKEMAMDPARDQAAAPAEAEPSWPEPAGAPGAE